MGKSRKYKEQNDPTIDKASTNKASTNKAQIYVLSHPKHGNVCFYKVISFCTVFGEEVDMVTKLLRDEVIGLHGWYIPTKPKNGFKMLDNESGDLL